MVSLVLVAMGRSRRQVHPVGSVFRRSAVAVWVVAWAYALTPLGFVLGSARAMAALLLIGQHQRWTPRGGVLYALAAAAVLGVMYTLFKHALQVPLP